MKKNKKHIGMFILCLTGIYTLSAGGGEDLEETSEIKIKSMLLFTYKMNLESIAQKTKFRQLALYLSMKMCKPTEAPQFPEKVTQELIDADILRSEDLTVRDPEIILLLLKDREWVIKLSKLENTSEK